MNVSVFINDLFPVRLVFLTQAEDVDAEAEVEATG